MRQLESTGQRLKKVRLSQGLSVPQLVEKIRRDHGEKIGESTIRDVEGDRVPNPGRDTVKKIALGLGLDPLQVLGLGVDQPDSEPGFKASQFARLWKSYSKLDEKRRAFVDDYIEMLIAKIEKWR